MTPKQKIAIVEDDEPIRQMYAIKLENSGFDICTAEDGQTGLTVVKEHLPDLILLDIMMPVMRGDEMLEKLRETDWGAGIRVVVLTNLSKDEAPHMLRFLNVDRYIVKAHHTPSQVVDIVKDILR